MKETRRSRLLVRITGLDSDQGQVIANLFRRSDPVLNMQRAFLRQTVQPDNGAAEVSFEDLSPGEYAVSAFHDVTSCGKVNHRLGIPVEKLGFSNGFVISLASGKPDFDKLKFEVREPETVLHIELRRVRPW